jgi:hypothetical protein
MPGQNKTKLIGWHSADPTLKGWVEAEASRRGMSIREFLDGALAAYRASVEPATPGTRP